MGDIVPDEIVRLMLFLKAQGLGYGHSGVQVETVRLLIDMLNCDMLPVVFQQGSLGASGDLAPLAHLCLPLIGMGEVQWKGKRMPAEQALSEAGLAPVSLRSKEGLALLNGTQFMSAYGVYCLIQARQIIDASDVIGALSLDGFDGRVEPFDPRIQQVRPHPGQIETARRYRLLLAGSAMASRSKQHVQDPYAFRCIPQVHGASKDTFDHVNRVLMTEVHAVTDNPTVFPDDDLVVSAGNFHGQPLALALDFLAIALAELGSISERRTYQLISGQRGLPPFLVANPGLDSGLMIPQYTAASIVSQSKQLCTPASVDSIVSSNGQEDHVSMGANAATKLFRVVENTQRVLAIEMLNASQALHFREPFTSSPVLNGLVEEYRKVVPVIGQDRFLHNDMQRSLEFLRTWSFASMIN
jgi:histidine ammonia-lyase